QVPGSCTGRPLNAIDKTAGVEQPSRIELVLHGPHEPTIVAWRAPNGQRSLPCRRTVPDDQVALRRRGRGLEFLHALLDALQCQVSLDVADHDAAAGVSL